MIFGISSKVLRDYSLDKAIAIAGELGYEVIELWIDDIISSGLSIDKIIELTDSNNLKKTIHLRTDDLNICSFNEGIRTESLRQAKEGIKIASLLGASEATLHPGRKTSKTHSFEEAWKIQLQSVKELSDAARECNVTLCVEGMEKLSGEFVLTPDDLCRITETCQNGFVGVTVDISHLQTHGDAAEILNNCKSLPVRNVHISQTTNEGLHLPLFLVGNIDYTKIFRMLNLFYAKAVIVEGYEKNKGIEIAEKSILWYKKTVRDANLNEK